MKYKWLPRSLLQSGYFTLCLNEKQYRAALKHLKIKKSQRPPFLSSSANATVHTFERNGEIAHIVCLGDTEGRTEEQILSLLVHEAVHIWQELKVYIGEKSPGHETEAYAIQNLSQSLMEEFFRQKKDKR